MQNEFIWVNILFKKFYIVKSQTIQERPKPARINCEKLYLERGQNLLCLRMWPNEVDHVRPDVFSLNNY